MDEAPPISQNDISEIKLSSSILLSSYVNNDDWELTIKIKDDNIIFTIAIINDFPNLIYEDIFSILELKENNKLLSVYDNIIQIYNFLQERIKNKYYKKAFKSPMIKIKDIIIKLKPKEIDKREILLMMTKETNSLKKSYNQIDQKISNLSTSISNLSTSISEFNNMNNKPKKKKKKKDK